MEQETDGPKIVDVEHPEPRIVGVDEAADEDEDRQSRISASLPGKAATDDTDDDPAAPDVPGDPETDNEQEDEPEGDGDDAPGDDAPAEITL